MTDALECDPYTVSTGGELTAFEVEADSPEEAIAAFWEGTNNRQEVIITLLDGLDITIIIDPDSVTAEAETDDQYVVEGDITVQTTLQAPNAESAIEQFQMANNNEPYLEVELVGGMGVSLNININDADAVEQ